LAILWLGACAVTGDPLLAEPHDGPPPGPSPTFYERLRDTPGPVPGLTGYTRSFVADAGTCDGFRVVIAHSGAAPTSEEQPLADMYAVEFPQNLDFSPGHVDEAKATFDRFLHDAMQIAERANEHYGQTIKSATDDRARIEAVAREALIVYRFASVLARAPITAEMRRTEIIEGHDVAPDKIKAYCEALHTAAEPLLIKAEKATLVCAAKAEAFGVHGWWDEVCHQRVDK
jgi:hypothetical protein